MRRALAIGLALALAACQGKQADTGKTAAAAEVLPGSASDAMIAYETLKSQPPLAVASASPSFEGRRTRDPASDGDETGVVEASSSPNADTPAPAMQPPPSGAPR